MERTLVADREAEAGWRRSSSGRKRLAEVCSPVFLFLTTFRRNSQTSQMGVPELRAKALDVLESTRRKLEDDPDLRNYVPRVWYTLVATADQAILTSDWRHRQEWQMQLLEHELFSSAEGGKRFYEQVEEILAKPGEAAAEVAEVLFYCMALGFQGALLGDSRRFERKRLSLYEKAQLPGSLGDTLTPDAYGRNATKQLTRLPTVGFSRIIVVILSVLFLLYFVGNELAGRQVWDVMDGIEGIEGKLEQELLPEGN